MTLEDRKRESDTRFNAEAETHFSACEGSNYDDHFFDDRRLGDGRLGRSSGRVQDVVRGNVLTPADEAYDRVRAPYNAMQIDRPALIVRARSGTADVVDTVNFGPAGTMAMAPGAGGSSNRPLRSNERRPPLVSRQSAVGGVD